MFHGMLLLFLVIYFISGLIPETAAAESLVINLKEEAIVVSDKVLLKHVADLKGPDRDQIEKLAQIFLCSAPAFGETVFLNRRQIGERIEAMVGHLPLDNFSGSAAVLIRLKGRPITADEIASLLKSHLVETTSWNESEITVHSIGSINGMELPPANGSLRISSDASIAGQRRILAPIEILHEGKRLRSLWITAEIAIRCEVWTAAKQIRSGKIVSEDDISPRVVEITDLRASYVRFPEDVLGKASRRNIPAGNPLTCESFTDPLLVKNGETVRLRLEREGIVLTSFVKAEQDGKLGQTIRVRNIDFSTRLNAEVTGKAEVQVQ
ncbi:MAG: flagellar basal body P-ring formation protein FlgA [Acidobacteria bacterium]|nr:flagellar basal body P-ring formation protein FlgA [Acidobacteriota bacterium]